MIVAVSMMRNEADVAAKVVEQLQAEGVDQIVVYDNLSTDDTADILRSVGCVVLDQPDPAYYQGERVSELAERACNMGADWVLPFDADEIWYSPHGRICDVLPECGVDVVYAHGWDHIATAQDPPGHPFTSMRWRRPNVQSMPKVAFKATPGARVHNGNHNVTLPNGGTARQGVLEFRHFQWRSFDHFVSKVRHGKRSLDLTNLDAGTGIHWRTYGAMSDEQLAHEWEGLCSTPGLVFDPAPLR